MDIAQLTAFLGWCTLLNVAVLLVAAIAVTLLRGPVLRLHGALLDVPPQELRRVYVTFLGNYKMLVIMFNLVPYLALRAM